MFKLALLLICFFSHNCYAYYCSEKKKDKSYPNKLNRCKITRSAGTSCRPAKFPLSNNLTKPDSGCAFPKGSKIIIKGQVLDQGCVPVSDAKVYLWQSGRTGRYKYGKNILDTDTNYFKGAGSTKSNNKGEFYFITMKPQCGPSSVNLRVEHPKLRGVSTRLAITPENILYDNIERKRCIDSALCKYPVYGFTIVMKGKTFRKY